MSLAQMLEALIEAEARELCNAEGRDPDEVVSYGPPISYGGSDPVEQEAPMWMLYSPAHRKRLGLK